MPMGPSFGSIASPPIVPRYRFRCLGSGSYFSILVFRYKVVGGYLHFFLILVLHIVWLNFGTVLFPNQELKYKYFSSFGIFNSCPTLINKQ